MLEANSARRHTGPSRHIKGAAIRNSFGKYPVALILAAIAFPVLSGCGGGGGSTSGKGPPLTHEQLVTQASAICAQANARTEALPATLANPQDLTHLAELAAASDPIGKDQLRKLEALNPSSQDKDAYDKLLSNARDVMGKLTSLRSAAEAGDAQTALKIGNDLSANPVGTEAEDLGLTECAKAPEPQG